MALCQQLIHGAVDCRGGNGEHASAWTEDRHSGDPPVHIDNRAALASRAQGKVKANQAVDGAAAAAMPSPARKGDDAERGEWSTLVISDRQDDPTGAQRGIGGRRDQQSVRPQPKDRDVSRWVATCKRSLDLPPARKRDFDVFVPLQRFLGGDDDTRTPMDSA